MRLLGVKIGVDDQFLQGKVQIPYFLQIDRSPGGKSREYSLSIGIGAVKLRIDAARPTRLRVDLRGYGTLPNAMLTHDQDRAVALGNADNRALNLRLNGGKRFRRGKRLRLSLHALDGCTACHEESWVTPLP